ncbi:MAG: DUF1573 domain-containing protein [Pedosphaera sp.]|nr:DUF1573 domain-containing protein [Pedosphaera sp.]
MKRSSLVGVLSFSLALICSAQQSAPPTRVLPVRLNPTVNTAPPPPAPQPLPPELTRPAQVTPLPAPAAPPQPMNLLAWDAETKEYDAKSGEAEAHYTFYFTNISEVPVVITSASASCGCAVPKLATLPWTNAPGATGEIPVTMTLAGKPVGVTFKQVFVNTDKGQKTLNVKVTIPAPPAAPVPVMNRDANQKAALADRQAIFKGDCVSCHVEKGKGKLGAELYTASCGICHDAEHRASAVPDLHKLNHDTNADFWKTWIAQGKVGTMMPAFGAPEGGPLNEQQINSLVQYLTATIPASPARAGN